MNYIGIDPGLTGAIAWVDSKGRLFGIDAMPTTTFANRKAVDPGALRDVLTEAGHDVMVGIEKLGPSAFNRSTNWSLSGSFHIPWAVCKLGSLPFILVAPKTWKKEYGITEKAGKEAAIEVARGMWPSFEFTRHDQADAALIAEYARRKRS